MVLILTIIFTIALALMGVIVVGFIEPSIVIRWGDYVKRDRLSVLKYYGVSCLGLLIVGSIILRDVSHSKTNLVQEEAISVEKIFADLSDSDKELLLGTYSKFTEEQQSQFKSIEDKYYELDGTVQESIKADFERIKAERIEMKSIQAEEDKKQAEVQAQERLKSNIEVQIQDFNQHMGSISDITYNYAENTFIIKPTSPGFISDILAVTTGSEPAKKSWENLVNSTKEASIRVAKNIPDASIAILNPSNTENAILFCSNGSVISNFSWDYQSNNVSSSENTYGDFWCMGKGDSCQNKTNSASDFYCNSCDPDGDNIEN